MQIKIVRPGLEDLDKVLAVEKACWPDIGKGMVMDEEAFRVRIKLGLMFMAEIGGEPAGIVSYQYPAFIRAKRIEGLVREYHTNGLLDWSEIRYTYKLPANWYEATNNGRIISPTHSTHQKDSDCMFLIGVGVQPKFRGHGLVSKLISRTLAEAKKEGKKFVFGYGRLPELHKRQKTSLRGAENYLKERKSNSELPLDFGARFHVRGGARCLSVIPNSMEDPESQNYGILIVYDLTTDSLSSHNTKESLSVMG